MQLVTISTVDARQEGAAVAVAPAFVVEATRHAFVDAGLVAVGGVSWLHTAAFLDVVQPAVVVLVPVKSVEKVAVRTRGPAVVVVQKSPPVGVDDHVAGLSPRSRPGTTSGSVQTFQTIGVAAIISI